LRVLNLRGIRRKPTIIPVNSVILGSERANINPAQRSTDLYGFSAFTGQSEHESSVTPKYIQELIDGLLKSANPGYYEEIKLPIAIDTMEV
jgi:hypothetical protein